MQTHSTIFDADQEEAFLATLQPAIAYLARRYYYRVRHGLSIDLADLQQEGMIAAWRALPAIQRAEGARKYCLIAARGAIIDIITEAFHQHTISLEDYLKPSPDAPARELADTPQPETHSSLTLRRAVLRLLREHLTAKQASVLMADFAIDAPATGKVETREEITKRLGFHPSAYRALRSRAMRTLRAALTTK